MAFGDSYILPALREGDDEEEEECGIIEKVLKHCKSQGKARVNLCDLHRMKCEELVKKLEEGKKRMKRMLLLMLAAVVVHVHVLHFRYFRYCFRIHLLFYYWKSLWLVERN